MSNVKRLTFKDFVFDFDVVSAGSSDAEDYAGEFLEYLSKKSLDKRYKLVFPLYYDFKLSSDGSPDLFMSGEAHHQWWIDKGDKKLVKGVQEHSQYGVGITKSYCKSNVKPSFLVMKKAADQTIDVEVRLYKSFIPKESYLVCGEGDAMAGDERTICDAQPGESRWNRNLSGIQVSFGGDQDDVISKLEGNPSFQKGIKSHYPILENSHAYVYYFFSNNLVDPKKEKSGFGGLFVVSNKRLKDYECGFFMLAGYTLSNKIALSQIQRTARIEATKSAIAKAMARNMSHNIGSHVLSNLVKEDIYDELRDARVKKLKSYISHRKGLFEGHKNRQLAFFLRYLKSRMDYMSEVTFGSPSLLVNRMIAGDVMKEFDGVRILLNHISGIPGFRYRFNLKYGNRSLEKDDIAVAFPGDVIGCQAFYNIIENVIRNTAKHTSRQNGEKEAVFTIRFKEPEHCECVDGADELFCVEIWGDVPEAKIDAVVTGQNERLNSSVLDESYNLRSHSLGLLEMEASAAFLRQLDLHEIESDNYDVDDDDFPYHTRNGRQRLNIIKAFAVYNGETDKNGEKRGSLAYRFFVQKPKEFLFVGNWEDVEPVLKKTLMSKGIGFLSFDEFRDLLKIGKSFAHEYLLYDDALPAGFKFSDYDALLPLRRIPVNDGNRSRLKSFLTGDRVFADLRDFVWSTLYERGCQITRDVPDVLEPDTDHIVLFHHPEYDFFTAGYTARKTLPGGEDHLFVESLSSRTLERMPCYDELSRIGFSSVLEDNYFCHLNSFFWKEGDEKLYSWIVKGISDAYGCRIVAIDERIQKYAEENKEDGFPCWAFFETTRVFMPRGPHRDVDGRECPPLDMEGNPLSPEDETFIPLAPEDFSDYREKLESYVKSRVDDAFLLIHYGILERMYGGKTEKIKKVLRSWAEGGDGEPKARRVVVTSGRGSHSLDLPDSVCFVNLSSVLYAFCESRNKYLMSFLLNQSRRKNHG